MKKYLPIGIFAVGLIVVVAAGILVLKRPSNDQPVTEAEDQVPEISFEKRPFASLTPSSDGHWLKMRIESIKISASTLDYELLYEVGDGRTQGVPGTVKLQEEKEIERDLLLGSESSGKFRYDEGVEEGSLTLRFRNEKGKVIGKFTSRFHLEASTTKVTSIDGVFGYSFDKVPKSLFFVTMETFGVPSLPEGLGSVKEGPYGVFASQDGSYSGEVSMGQGKIHFWNGTKWTQIDGKSSNIGVFLLAE